MHSKSLGLDCQKMPYASDLMGRAFLIEQHIRVISVIYAWRARKAISGQDVCSTSLIAEQNNVEEHQTA
jgi:hypothetical protein